MASELPFESDDIELDKGETEASFLVDVDGFGGSAGTVYDERRSISCEIRRVLSVTCRWGYDCSV